MWTNNKYDNDIMDIQQYDDMFRDDIIDLILNIQNNEAKINLSLLEQPDLMDINSCYIKHGGNFWVAVENGHALGTIGLMNLGNGWGALKKFFVRADCRSRKVGLSLYRELLKFARDMGYVHIVLDTPSVAVRSHSFYEKAGFVRVKPCCLSIDYRYPDRNSILYQLDL